VERIADVVFLTIAYPGKVIANVHVSWLDPQKVRKMTIVGSRKMVVYDDVADDKIAIYDKGIDQRAVLSEHMDFDQPMPRDFGYRSGDVLLPHITFAEPLRAEAEHFVECIRTNKEPDTGIRHARSVVSILERAESPRVRVEG
jgi:predicted dehydrogenase